MELHEITKHGNKSERIYMRKMKVENGYLYNFWSSDKDDY